MCVSCHYTLPTRYLTIFFSFAPLFHREPRTHTQRESGRDRASKSKRERARERERPRESKRDQKQARARILREFDFPDAHTHTAIIGDTNTCCFFFSFFFTPRYDYWTSSSSSHHHHPSRPRVSQDAHVTTGDDDGGERTQLLSWRRLFCFSNFFFTARFRFERGVN